MTIHDEFPAFTVRGYGRASTDKQVLSTEQQESVCVQVFELRKRIYPQWINAVWGGFFSDEATCREVRLRERTYGSIILSLTRPGDRISCAAQDRLCGSLVDFCETIQMAQTGRFKLLICDKEMDPDDESTMCCHQIMAACAELEIKRLRRRTRESMAYRRKVGLPAAGKPPIGWRHAQYRIPGMVNVQKRLIYDHAVRRLALEILAVKEEGKLCYKRAAYICNHRGPKHISGRRWNLCTFIKWCRAAENNFPLLNGSHEASPLPGDAIPVVLTPITVDD